MSHQNGPNRILSCWFLGVALLTSELSVNAARCQIQSSAHSIFLATEHQTPQSSWAELYPPHGENYSTTMNIFAPHNSETMSNSTQNGERRPGPNVPEPMVFDLIRPLGVRKGELEANVLGFVPFRRTRSKPPQFSFITGADQSTQNRPSFEWAPEIEYGVTDNFALEFELPLAEARIEAYKAAAQYTLGTAFNDQFIHGLQGILFLDRTNGAVSPTLLYIAAARFDPVYSMLGMIGFSHEFGGDNPNNPTQVLLNLTLFAELSQKWTLGLEVNYASELDGAAALLFMPQIHWTPNEKFSIQMGIGTRTQEGNLIGEAAFRVIREF